MAVERRVEPQDDKGKSMGAEDLGGRYEFAFALIKEAGEIALEDFHNLSSLTVARKGLQDVVTEADLKTERFIRNRLATRFPEDGFLGEETGRDGFGAARCLWVVDPIDGTQPFISGMTAWCVSIALVVDGRLEMGFVNAPARDELFAGRRGGRSTLNGEPIRVSDVGGVDHGIVGVGYSPRVTPDQFLAFFSPLLRQGGTFYRDGSGALTLCYVACGRLIGYIEAHINSWDCLGALAVIESAGGTFNNFLANDGLFRGNWLVAGPGKLTPILCDLLRGADGL